MRIQRRDYNDITVVQLQGDLDIDNIEQLRKVVEDVVSSPSGINEGNQEQHEILYKTGLVFDMSEVGFIDSKGLEFLLWARDYCHENTCQLRLAGLDENCTKIMEITRLDSEFTFYQELAEAVKSFA